jgi:uncharacterized membrane protein YvbJ
VPRDVCPNCGADLPPKAKSCPECGSDEETGWSEEAQAADLGIPEDNFDYNEFVKNEFEPKGKQKGGLKWYWVAAAVVLIVMFIKLMMPW